MASGCFLIFGGGKPHEFQLPKIFPNTPIVDVNEFESHILQIILEDHPWEWEVDRDTTYQKIKRLAKDCKDATKLYVEESGIEEEKKDIKKTHFLVRIDGQITTFLIPINLERKCKKPRCDVYENFNQVVKADHHLEGYVALLIKHNTFLKRLIKKRPRLLSEIATNDLIEEKN